jgi:hypothetical protein
MHSIKIICAGSCKQSSPSYIRAKSLPLCPTHQQQKHPNKSHQLWSKHELHEYWVRLQITMKLAVEQIYLIRNFTWKIWKKAMWNWVLRKFYRKYWHYPHKELGLVEGREDDLVNKDRSWIPVENWEASLTKSHKTSKYTRKLEQLGSMLYWRKDNL